MEVFASWDVVGLPIHRLEQQEAKVAVGALNYALDLRKIKPDHLLMHTDQGSQYTR